MSEPSSSVPDALPLAAVLELVAMQLEVAMQHAAAEAERLSMSVADVARIGGRISERLTTHGDAALTADAAAIARESQRALTAMQFHDQLAQRVAHVRNALGDVHAGLRAGGDPDWSALLRRMRSHYTMEDERRLFDMVLGKLPGAGAAAREEALPGSVELF